MLHACAVRFDVTENLENFWKLNKAYARFRRYLGLLYKFYSINSTVEHLHKKIKIYGVPL